jgi:hypothetical protein
MARLEILGSYSLCSSLAHSKFETSPRRERQLEGIARGKSTGIWKGYFAAADVDRVVLGYA